MTVSVLVQAINIMLQGGILIITFGDSYIFYLNIYFFAIRTYVQYKIVGKNILIVCDIVDGTAAAFLRMCVFVLCCIAGDR